jgi:hypothetical protein
MGGFEMDRHVIRRRCGTLACGGALALAMLTAGCSTTVESEPAAAKAVESGGTLPPDITGFLGADASKLQPGPKGGAALVYINHDVQWASYNKVLLEPVQFWASADSKVSTADQQTLTTYFYTEDQSF